MIKESLIRKILVLIAAGQLSFLAVAFLEWNHYKEAERIVYQEFNNRQLLMAQSSARGINSSFSSIILLVHLQKSIFRIFDFAIFRLSLAAIVFLLILLILY